MAELRIVSLIPSATDILAELGLIPHLVGRSHECDQPPEVRLLPPCTAPAFPTGGPSRAISDRVSALLDEALTIYTLDLDTLARLAPTHILTQDRCAVCAVDLSTVERAAADRLGGTTVISLQPARLGDVAADIRWVGAALGIDGEPAAARFEARLAAVRAATAGLAERPTVACIEWTDPPMAAGHWVPELVDLAGGRDCFGKAGEPAFWLEEDALRRADPEVVAVMPCGYDLDRTRDDVANLAALPGWSELRAVRDGRVYAADGNRYFSRPGPGLAQSAEILAEMLHPEHCRFGHRGRGWAPAVR